MDEEGRARHVALAHHAHVPDRLVEPVEDARIERELGRLRSVVVRRVFGWRPNTFLGSISGLRRKCSVVRLVCRGCRRRLLTQQEPHQPVDLLVGKRRVAAVLVHGGEVGLEHRPVVAAAAGRPAQGEQGLVSRALGDLVAGVLGRHPQLDVVQGAHELAHLPGHPSELVRRHDLALVRGPGRMDARWCDHVGTATAELDPGEADAVQLHGREIGGAGVDLGPADALEAVRMVVVARGRLAGPHDRVAGQAELGDHGLGVGAVLAVDVDDRDLRVRARDADVERAPVPGVSDQPLVARRVVPPAGRGGLLAALDAWEDEVARPGERQRVVGARAHGISPRQNAACQCSPQSQRLT